MGKPNKSILPSRAKTKDDDKKRQTKISQYLIPKDSSDYFNTPKKAPQVNKLKRTEYQPNLNYRSLGLTFGSGNLSVTKTGPSLRRDFDLKKENISNRNKLQKNSLKSLKTDDSFDNSCDIVECSPEVDVSSRKITILKDSPNDSDFIPPTPVPNEKKCQKINKTSLCNLKVFNKCSVNAKRPAENRVGVSPNSKKCLGESGATDRFSYQSYSCGVNSFIESSIGIGSADESFSLLQMGLQQFRSNASENVKDAGKLQCRESDLKKEFENNVPITNTQNVLDGNVTAFKCEDFDKLSPFEDKEKVSRSQDSLRQFDHFGVADSSDLVGSSSYVVIGDYGRHTVLSVERDVYLRKVVLRLKCSKTGLFRSCILIGFWYDSVVREGDIIHILNPDRSKDSFLISDDKGMVVINPDFLLSGTSVVSGVFCRRKAVLSERFKGFEPANKNMQIGSIIHQVFQEFVQTSDISDDKLELIMKNLLKQMHIMRELYTENLEEEEVIEELKSFKLPILSWCKAYLKKVKSCEIPVNPNHWNGVVEDIEDIEENIWSPKFGIKGKLDLTVTTEGVPKKTMPLELKTGKPSFSLEHQGQVILYSMMNSDRREDSGMGLLYYVKDGSIYKVPAGDKEKKGLIQLRNELVSYLTSGKDVDIKIPSLPEPLSNERICPNCPHLLLCSAFQKISNTVPDPPHPMFNFVPSALQHLNELHLEYFRKWILLLNLEVGVSLKSSSTSALWCLNAEQRETAGDCLRSLKLVDGSAVKVDSTCSDYFIVRFNRDPSSKEKLPLIFEREDSVVVSSERDIAVASGVIRFMDATSITVALDRDLKLSRNWREKVFRLDRCEYQNVMSSFFTNLANLMQDNSRAESLRSLIIDRRRPEFSDGLDFADIVKTKQILRNLNENQQRAILRSLLTKDYCIIKGFPGSGKTSTIVSLVRVLGSLGKSILISSYTHSAVDNILLKLKEWRDEFTILRLGKQFRIHADLQEFSDDVLTRNFHSVKELKTFYDSQQIVASVCLGMKHPIFRHRIFDYCIIDEASQVLQIAALGPLFFCKKFILVGDELQLPPVVKSSAAKSLGMLQSLLEYLDDEKGSVYLSIQYRMNEPIMKIANDLSYKGRLKSASEELKITTLCLPLYPEVKERGKPKWILRCVSPRLKDAVLFLNTGSAAPEVKLLPNQPTNPNESRIILNIAKTFIEMGLHPTDLGIITPYRAQVKLLSSEVGLLHPSIEVNTVDQYQGRDKAAIIYSCVRSGLTTPDVKKGEILHDVRRLSVAITRARFKLILVGNLDTLKLFEPFKHFLEILHSETQVYTVEQGKDEFDINKLSFL